MTQQGHPNKRLLLGHDRGMMSVGQLALLELLAQRWMH